MMSPALVVHIAGGTVGLLSGIVAVSARKGERLHRIAGTAFFVSMLFMSAMATYLAIPLQQMGNAIGGVVTFYLVATAWMTVRRKEGTTGAFEIVAMLFAAAAAAGCLLYGVIAMRSHTPLPDGGPPQALFFMAGVVGLAAAFDLKVVLNGGISGVQRIARHLWRMCFALFVASGSFYVQFIVKKVHMPAFLHGSPLLFIPIVAPLLLIVFWMYRVRLTNWFKADPVVA